MDRGATLNADQLAELLDSADTAVRGLALLKSVRNHKELVCPFCGVSCVVRDGGGVLIPFASAAELMPRKRSKCKDAGRHDPVVACQKLMWHRYRVQYEIEACYTAYAKLDPEHRALRDAARQRNVALRRLIAAEEAMKKNGHGAPLFKDGGKEDERQESPAS